MAIRLAVATAVCLFASLAPRGGLGQLTGAPGEPELQARIDRLILQLDDARFDQREAASSELEKIGAAASDDLTAAARHASAEVRWRATVILTRLRITPLTQLAADQRQFASQPDDELDLEEGMWLISRLLDSLDQKPGDKVEAARLLDEIANKVRERLGKDADPAKIDPSRAIDALLRTLVDDYDFHSNPQFSKDPINATLEGALKNRTAAPITLGHVAIAVARRLGLPIVGVPVSGYYLIKYDGARSPFGFSRGDIYISPGEEFKILSREERLEKYPGYDPDVMEAPDTSREVLQRMLRNLVSALAGRDDPLDLLRRQLAEEFHAALEAQSSENSAR